MKPTFPKCSQCGNYHPLIPVGVKCPMLKEKDAEGKEIDFGNLFKDLKNICTSQIQSKKIQNHNKLFTFMIVQLTKILEDYKE